MNYHIPYNVKKIPIVKKRTRQERMVRRGIRRGCMKAFDSNGSRRLVAMIFDAYMLEYMTSSGYKSARKTYRQTITALKKIYTTNLMRMLKQEAGHISMNITCFNIRIFKEYKQVPKELDGTWFKSTSRSAKFDFDMFKKAKALDYMQLFAYCDWESHYGDIPWARIAYYTHVLFEAHTDFEIMKALDHIHQLSHNTGSCLNKFRGLERNFKDVLDAKAHKWSISIMREFISPDVARMYRVFRKRDDEKTWPLQRLWDRKSSA